MNFSEANEEEDLHIQTSQELDHTLDFLLNLDFYYSLKCYVSNATYIYIPTTCVLFCLGLRAAAEIVNHNLTEWYHSQDWGQNTNIVAIDFFRGSGIVRAAIEWNKFKGRCP